MATRKFLIERRYVFQIFSTLYVPQILKVDRPTDSRHEDAILVDRITEH